MEPTSGGNRGAVPARQSPRVSIGGKVISGLQFPRYRQTSGVGRFGIYLGRCSGRAVAHLRQVGENVERTLAGFGGERRAQLFGQL
jgi:hypothetical protein